MANSENTITSAFVNVLRYMREAWRVDEQITKPFLNATQKPDVIVSEKGRNPVVIEVKVDGDTPNYTGKLQAEAHFGMLLSIHLLLNEVLDITSEDAHNAVHRLRELLSAEPSIHGGKKSRCNLEKEWEKLSR